MSNNDSHKNNSSRKPFRKGTSDKSGSSSIHNLPSDKDYVVEYGEPKTEEELDALRSELKNVFDKIILDLKKEAKEYEKKLEKLPMDERICLYNEHFKDGILEPIDETVDPIKKVYKEKNIKNFDNFIEYLNEKQIQVGIAIADAAKEQYYDFKEKDWSTFINDYMADASEVKEDLKKKAVQAGKKLKNEFDNVVRQLEKFSDDIKESIDSFKILMRDKKTRKIIIDFSIKYIQYQHPLKRTKIAGRTITEIAMILVTKGAGTAHTVLTKSKYFLKASDIINKIIGKLKKINKLKKEFPLNKNKKNKKVTKDVNKKKNKEEKPPPNCPQGQKCEKVETSGEPISMVSGEELLQQIDFTLSGPIPFTFQRTYRSKGRFSDFGLGHGWAFSICERLFLTKDHLVFQDNEGREILCLLPEIGKHSIQGVEGLTIIRESEHTFRLKQDGMPDKLFVPNTILGQPVKKYVDYNSKTFLNPECIYQNESGHLIYRNSNADDVFCLLTESNQQTRYVIQDVEIIKVTDNSFLMKQTEKPDRTFSLMVPLSKYIDLDNNYIDFQ